MAEKLKFTAARLNGLRELASNGGEARISNRTEDGAVYWQTATWLVDHQLATDIGREGLLITDLGRQTWEAQQ